MGKKKYLLVVLLLNCSLIVFAQNAETLDEAIQRSANQIIRQILLRVDMDSADLFNNVTVAILDFDTSSNDLSEYIITDLTKYFLRNPEFTMVERQFLDRARGELDFNMPGEASGE